MSAARENILQALRGIRLIDPHSHINPHAPASKTLADLLGYHYYTELAHSAGMPKVEIESRLTQPRELVGRLVEGLGHITNTAQYAWLIDICQRFFGLQSDSLDTSNWEAVYDAAEAKMQMADWCDSVLEQSNVESVFLTNDFDDPLEGFDTDVYVPCLRTDDLVFHLSKQEVRDRLAVSSGVDLDGSLHSLRSALAQRFELFVSRGARACAISLPPDFCPQRVSDGRAATALDAILKKGPDAEDAHKAAIARRVFWTIVELCDEYRLPMDLMIGVNRGVYAEGVHQGRDLYDSRVSLIQYRELFNAFPDVKFPISVLASVTNQELVSYAWIFPNVITNGHWWYSNTPSFIRRDAQARLEAVPRNKQIGYYSDAYKLEFIAPKFDMYRRILAGILFDDFVVERGWSEEQAIELGRQVLRGNVETIFPRPPQLAERSTGNGVPESIYDGAVDQGAGGLGASDLGMESLGMAAVAAGAASFAFSETDDSDQASAGQSDEMLSGPDWDQVDDSELSLVSDEQNGMTDSWMPESGSLANDVASEEPQVDDDVMENADDDVMEIEAGDLEPLGFDLADEPIVELNDADLEPLEDSSEVSDHEPLMLDDADLSLEPMDAEVQADAPEIQYYRGDDELQPVGDASGELQLDSFDIEDELPASQDDESELDWYANPNTGELTLPTPSESGQGEELDEQYLLSDVEPVEDDGLLDLELLADDEPQLEEFTLPEDDLKD